MRAALWLAAGFALALPARAQEVLQQAPFFTTPEAVVARMLELARTGPGDTVLDLGSGDGRIVIRAARAHGARGIGLELDPGLVERARETARRAGVSNQVVFRVEDLMRADLSGATVITAYLVPYQLERLEPRLLAGARPGTRVVTHVFALPSWHYDATEAVRVPPGVERRPRQSRIYLYVVPAQVRGDWRGPAGWRLRIAQNFQKVEVQASRDGRPLEVATARLSGERLEVAGPAFSLDARLAEGRLRGELSGRGPVSFERVP